MLTPKTPTSRHHCLAHVLSVSNSGTVFNGAEVWGGPLASGDLVLALLNRGAAAATIRADWAMFGMSGVGAESAFKVWSLWGGEQLGLKTGGLSQSVPSNDIAIFRLSKA